MANDAIYKKQQEEEEIMRAEQEWEFEKLQRTRPDIMTRFIDGLIGKDATKRHPIK